VNGEAVGELRDVVGQHPLVTLVYGAKDEEHNQAVVLRDYLAATGPS
jgi:DNA-3-methyladenine glycosylase